MFAKMFATVPRYITGSGSLQTTYLFIIKSYTQYKTTNKI